MTNPDTAKIRAGLAREDLFTVVHDPFMTATARYADIVLPATTYLETEDFYRSYGTYYMQYGQRVVRPVGEAWSNLRLTQALAARLGLTDPVFSMTPAGDPARTVPATAGIDIDPATLLDGAPVSIGPKAGQRFRTPSGKLEFFSQTLADQGLPPMPDWQPDPADKAACAAAPADHARIFPEPHGVFRRRLPARARGRALRRSASRRRRVAWPARRPGRSAQTTTAARSRYVCVCRDEVQPGVVLVPGQRPDEEAASGTVNMLCADGYTDMGAGATYQSTWLEVSAAT